uniref:Uncharacterized protein n=1 Tax=viral metagenome TaxID=1070528 RepID=A0A6H1Z8V7_9ZZZZ
MSECKCGGIGCQTCTPPDAVGHCQRTAARQLADILQVDPDADARIDQLVNRATAGAKMSPYTITPQALAAVWAELATTDPARPCRDLLGILGAIRNVAARREPPATVPTILVELARLDGEP